MLKPIALANAFAVLIAVVYFVCAAWVVVARDSFMVFTGTWVHGINMKILPYTPPTLRGLVVGFVTAVVAGWLSGYLFAWLYNRFSKK